MEAQPGGAAHELDDRYRAMLDEAAIGIAHVETGTGRYLVVNRKLCEMLGYSESELLSLRWQQVTEPTELDQDVPAVRRMEAIGAPYVRDKRYVRKDGSKFWASLTVSPLASPGAPFTTQLAVITDITAQKLAEEALREGERRFRALFEQAAVGMAEVDSQSGHWMRVNDALCEILGYPREELLTKSWRELTHPDDMREDEASYRRMLEDHAAYAREKRYLRKDGATVWVELSVSPLWAAGEPPTRHVSVVKDVTARKRAEEGLRQAQKLESIGRLAGGVAHDFNNLLTVILSCSDAVKDGVERGRLPDVEDVEQIRAAGERARDLTRQLLAFARKQVIAPVPLELDAVVRGCERMLGRLLGEDVVLTVTLASGPWRVLADPGQLEQIVLNLAVNARDAMPRGGALELATDPVTLDERSAATGSDERPGEYVRLTVRDAGTGLSEEARRHLFEPFFTTKPVGQGTGLGLATVYGIVKQSGGHLRVESTVGRGTTFEIFLPRTLATPAVASTLTQAQGRGHEALLLVEDDPQVRNLTVRLLRAGGYEVHVAAHPQRALDLPLDELRRVRLLITDVVMPGLDGRALAEALRRQHPSLQVLYVSGYTHDVIAERGVLDSGTQFLAKPFTGSTLLARVRALLDAGE